MFFVLSKVFWFFIQPINLSLFLCLAGIAASWFGWRRLGGAAATAGLFVLAICAWTNIGALLLRPLEDRYARPLPPREKVAGIVVLGGGLEGAVNLARGGYELNAAGDRFVEAAALALRYPQAKVVISGGSGSLMLDGETDAATAPRLLTALGVSPERLVLEGKSRNTYENAIFTRELVQPKPGETWLLVTSAFHMPRSMGLFRRADFPVVPWPTDYRTRGDEGFALFDDDQPDSIRNASLGIREWIGLAAYRLSGRTDALIP